MLSTNILEEKMRFILPFLLIRILVATSSNTENGRSQRTSPVPAPFSSSQRSLAAIKVDPSGKVYTTQILKQQLANELGLPLRDLRIIDPSFPSQIQASFISRRKAILFCIENIKVVVQHNEALVFGPFQPEVQEFVPALQLQIAQVRVAIVVVSSVGVDAITVVVFIVAITTASCYCCENYCFCYCCYY